MKKISEMTIRIEKAMLNVAFFCLIGLILTIVIFTYETLKPYDILDIPPVAAITDNTVQKGGYLIYKGYMNKKLQYPSTQDCYFIDSVQISVSTKETNRPVGEYWEDVAVYIPKILVVGDVYIYRCNITYEINPFRSVRYTWQTKPFTIVK
jgi:hypothetical protein